MCINRALETETAGGKGGGGRASPQSPLLDWIPSGNFHITLEKGSGSGSGVGSGSGSGSGIESGSGSASGSASGSGDGMFMDMVV